jgi:hypothetical protein
MDRGTGDVLIHGGAPPPSYDPGSGVDAVAETWALTTGSTPGWLGLSRIARLVDRPWTDPRAHFDAHTRQLVTWTREGVGPATWRATRLGTCSRLAGGRTAVRRCMSVIDPVRRRLLVFGGGPRTATPQATSRMATGCGPGHSTVRARWSSTASMGGAGTSHRHAVRVRWARDRVIALPSARGTRRRTVGHAARDQLRGRRCAQWARMPTVGDAPTAIGGHGHHGHRP